MTDELTKALGTLMAMDVGPVVRPNPYAEAIEPYAASLRMIRDAIGELFGPIADLESEEAVLLRGPEPHHDAEAIIAALKRVEERLFNVRV